jgi:hypothetical protein
MNVVKGGADISACGQYRYRLWRDGLDDYQKSCLFIMLNPSTADGNVDDQTIRKCTGFCKCWGYGLLIVCNLFAFRSTKPSGLLAVDDAIGPENDEWLRSETAAAHRIVLAWGSHNIVNTIIDLRTFQLTPLLSRYIDKTFVLGRCKNGNPRHPLMLPYDTVLERWLPK